MASSDWLGRKMDKLTFEQGEAVKKLSQAHAEFQYWSHELAASKNKGIEIFVESDKRSVVHHAKEIRKLQRELGVNLYHDIRALTRFHTDIDIGE